MTRTLTITVVATCAVLVALAVTALVLWRGDIAQERHARAFERCMEDLGAEVGAVSVEAYSEAAVLCTQ